MGWVLLLGNVNAAGNTGNDMHINLSGDSKWPLCVCEWCVCWTCLSRMFVGPIQVAMQVYFLSCFPALPAEFRQIRGRRRLFVHFRVFTMCEKGKIKEKILQPTDGESPSAPIGLLLERKWGGGRGGGGLGLRG